jgi:hypothetical protein
MQPNSKVVLHYLIDSWDFSKDFAVAEDLKERSDYGLKKHGVRLFTYNGRSALVDLYQEVLDAIFYGAQLEMEGDTEGHVDVLVYVASQIRRQIDGLAKQ